MQIDLLVNFESFWRRLAQDIGAARKRVLVQTFSFEGDCAGTMLADALRHSGVPDKRILVDSFAKVVLSDKFLYAPAHWRNAELREEARRTTLLHAALGGAGVQIKYGNPLGPTPRRLLTRNHKKLIIIDDGVAYIGGINFSEHNASWHDMMLRIDDGGIADFFCEDFEAAWRGQRHGATKRFPGIELSTLDGRSNKAAFAGVLELLDQAQQSIFVESPYVTFPFYDRLREARKRGVFVTIITPKENNWSHFADYARWESGRCRLDLRLFRSGMSHLKAMLIDNRYLIAGSSNFDFLSYRIYQEILAIITEPKLITSFREQVLEVDLRNSEVANEIATSASAWARMRVRLLNMGLSLLLE